MSTTASTGADRTSSARSCNPPTLQRPTRHAQHPGDAMTTHTQHSTPAQRVSPDAVERAVRGLAAYWVELTRLARGGSYVERGGVASIRSGLALAAFNGVCAFGGDVDAADVLVAADAFRSGDLPWHIELR